MSFITTTTKLPGLGAPRLFWKGFKDWLHEQFLSTAELKKLHDKQPIADCVSRPAVFSASLLTRSVLFVVGLVVALLLVSTLAPGVAKGLGASSHNQLTAMLGVLACILSYRAISFLLSQGSKVGYFYQQMCQRGYELEAGTRLPVRFYIEQV